MSTLFSMANKIVLNRDFYQLKINFVPYQPASRLVLTPGFATVLLNASYFNVLLLFIESASATKLFIKFNKPIHNLSFGDPISINLETKDISDFDFFFQDLSARNQEFAKFFLGYKPGLERRLPPSQPSAAPEFTLDPKRIKSLEEIKIEAVKTPSSHSDSLAPEKQPSYVRDPSFDMESQHARRKSAKPRNKVKQAKP